MKKKYQIDLKGEGDYTDTTKNYYDGFPGYKRIVDSKENIIENNEDKGADYWKKRCEAAENVIKYSLKSKLNQESLKIWQELKNKNL